MRKRTPLSRTLCTLAVCGALPVLLGCGGDAGADADLPLGSRDNSAEVEAYYRDKVVLPVNVREALERGEITQEEVDRRSAAGEFPKFFRVASPEDLPSDLEWENGADLPAFASPRAKRGGTMFHQVPDFPRTLRIAGPDSNGSFRKHILDDTGINYAHRHPNLTEVDADGFRYYPGVAKEWALDWEDRRVYVRLDPDARFSNGEAITVDDVFFSFYFYQSPYLKAPWYNNFYNRNYTELVRYDDYTFSLQVPEAKPDMAARVLELRPLPRDFFKAFGEDYTEAYQWQFVPTAGPYRVLPEHLDKGRSVTLTRVDEWWGDDKKFWRGRFNPDRIHFTIIRDKAKAFEAFKKGDLDIMGRLREPEYWYDKLGADDPLVADGFIHMHQFYNDVPRPSWGLWINTAQPLLENRDVRLGIQHASNWDLVIQRYFRGDYERMRTPNDGYGPFSHPTLQPYRYSVDDALAAFARAGFEKRGGDGVLVDGQGRRLSFTLSTGYESHRDILTILREEALKAGLELRLEILDSTAAFKKVQEKQHDIHYVAISLSTEMYPRYWDFFHSVNAYDRAFLDDGSVNPERKPKPQTNNMYAFADLEMDAMIERYRASESAEEMIELSHRMAEKIKEEAIFVPGFVMPFLRVASWRWVGWPDDFNVKLATDFEEHNLFWIDEEERERTRKARRGGETFPAVTKVYDTYRAR